VQFTVIVPTYGRPDFLAEALSSIQRQTLADFECLVIDDCSPTPVVLPPTDSRFRLIRLPSNSGPAAARNEGIRQARGELIAFLDDDDLFTPERLEIALSGLRSADCSICSGAPVDGQQQSPSFLSGAPDHLFDSFAPNLGQIAIRRTRCIPFDESYRACEDLDWLLRVVATCQVNTDDRCGWQWRRHDEVRGSHGIEARVTHSKRLLLEHNEFFAGNPRARAFRWHRISQMSLALGDRATAREAAWASVRSSASRENLHRNLKIVASSLRS
jgi:glycosyltransferase involved in cell wall biosynthesis